MADFVYWEEQESGFCAVHCLNNLLQGAYFTEIDLSEMALKLDEQEKQMMAQAGVDSADFLAYMARDESEHVNAGGNFSIEVIRKCLEVMQLHCVSVQSEEAKGVIADPTSEQAFICNLQSHWFAVRRLHNEWINLNSLEKKPVIITPFYLNVYFAQLVQEGYSIFVVRGDFPPYQSSLEGRGKRFSLPQLRAAGTPARTPAKGNRRPRPPTPPNDDDDLAVAIALSMQQPPASSALTPAAAVVSPPGQAPAVGGGAAVASSSPSAPILVEDGDSSMVDADDELQQALRMSLQPPAAPPS